MPVHIPHSLTVYRILYVLGLLAAFAAQAGEPSGPSAPEAGVAREHRLIVITDDDLHPEKLKLAPGQFVAWISYASQPVRVVFEKDVAREMVCEHPMNFTLEDEGLRSDPLAPGEFASFCELRAGKFEYRVEPVSGKGDELKGELKVRER